MKLRQGFVSNSSSCSFIVIGYEIPNTYTEEELDKMVYDVDDSDFILGNDENGIPEGKLILGDHLSVDFDEYREYELDFKEKNEYYLAKLKEYNIPGPYKFKMFTGTMMC